MGRRGLKIIFDTYAWIEYFLGSEQGKIVEDYLKAEPITPIIVLLELSYRANKENWDFKKYLDFIKFNSRTSSATEDFILDFGALYNKTKNKIPGVGIADVIVLMTAIKENAKILTGDTHFKGMPQTIFLE